ncbi:MAG TPA: pentapeptide repeat-containing protein [Dermacoccus sp.]|nr:pentapeptide repeat-containing protein [Dermacoccus sp.]
MVSTLGGSRRVRPHRRVISSSRHRGFIRATEPASSLRRTRGARCEHGRMSDTTRGERFVEVDFYERDLDGARFVDCRFTACDFTEKNLVDVTFEGCALFDCRFNDTTLERVAFTGATLSGCSFAMTTLDGCKLTGSTFADCGWRHTTIVGGHWAMVTMRQQKLDGLDFTGARLSDADLSESSLRRTVFADADLSGATLRGADLRDADLRGARVDGIDLAQARFAQTRMDVDAALAVAAAQGIVIG